MLFVKVLCDILRLSPALDMILYTYDLHRAQQIPSSLSWWLTFYTCRQLFVPSWSMGCWIGRKILYQWRSIAESLNIGQTDAINGGFSIATFDYWRITKWSPTVHPAVPKKTASKACWVAGIYKTIVTAEAHNYRTIYAIITYIRQI